MTVALALTSGPTDHPKSVMPFIQILVGALALLFLAPAASASTAVNLEASYSEPANLFSLMDNVSGWQEGLTDPAYREDWSRRFGWTSTDQEWVERYAEYRRRTYSQPLDSKLPSQSPDGMFAPASSSSQKADPLAAHFFRHSSVATALETLNTSASVRDVRVLDGFYRHFAAGWRVILAESYHLAASAKTLHDQLNAPGVSAFVGRVARFYRTDIGGSFRAFFVWQPPGQHSNAELVAGRNFLIHLPPDQAGRDDDWDTVAVHELVHYISARQSPEQKQALTKLFLARCPGADRPKPFRLLEEPLAVAWGQAAYAKYVRSKPLHWEKQWHAVPIVDLLGHGLWPTVDGLYNTEARITDGLVDVAARRCADVFAAADFLKAAETR